MKANKTPLGTDRTQLHRVAQRLVKARGGRPREEVARAVGISLAALERYEGGGGIPRDEVKARLAAYYHTTAEDLFFDLKCHER